MIVLRPSNERGHANHGWLDTYHTFSFASYFDPQHMGFGALRVINEDKVDPGEGFGTHPHRDMEIITYVLDGALQHRDSMGNGSIIRPGDVQRMTAGTGVAHSEFNASAEKPVHLLQIWILPERGGLEPGYEEKKFAREDKLNALRLIASRDGQDGSVLIHQDVKLYASILETGKSVEYDLRKGRKAWIQVARGRLTFNGHTLEAGDGAAVTEAERLQLEAGGETEFLLFDLKA
ncbi:MAG TPA: pirin family protein [Bdellovibrionales bacterium]|nr:pirin family protein [Bdellovibrionales bacterium]